MLVTLVTLQVGVIDYSLYMKDIRQNAEPAPEDDATPPPTDPSSLLAVLDQKNYLEEINLHLTYAIVHFSQRSMCTVVFLST